MALPERQPAPKTVAASKPLDPAIAERLRELRQPPSPEELARRQKAVAKLLQGRDSMPFLDTDPSEFLRQSREEDEISSDG